MSYPINYPTPQGANIQIFKEGGSTSDWVKPQGASFVWFTLIGAGGGAGYTLDTSAGAAGGGGGSASVTNCMVPAFLIPDVLRITIGKGGIGAKTSVGAATSGENTVLSYQQKATSAYTLLTANGAGGGTNGTIGATGTGGAAGTATTSNYFTCMGFFQSVAGQDGTIGTTSAPTNTFLTAGGCADIVGNYGYGIGQSTNPPASGYFQMQPIIMGYGGNSAMGAGGSNATTNGGIGCGGGSSFYGPAAGANGGDGLVVIVTW
jgi:hypothetical protein